MDALTIGAIVSALVGGAGLTPIVKAIVGRRTVKADAAATLSDNALKWVEQFQEDARAARQEVAECRVEMAAARRETAEIRREAHDFRTEAAHLRLELAEVLDMVRQLRAAIMDPTVTRDQLRRMARDVPELDQKHSSPPQPE